MKSAGWVLNEFCINQTIRDLCITLILAKIWEFTIDFIVKNLMKFANIELCRGLYQTEMTPGIPDLCRGLKLL
jgi:hypothetical protein